MNRFYRFLALAVVVASLAACGQGESDESDIIPIRNAYTKGFYLEARSGYERYLQLYPRGEFRLEAWERLLEIALNVSGNLGRSINLLEAMILEFGNQSEVAWELMNRLGALYEQNHQRTKALEAHEKSLDFSQDDPEKTVATWLAMAKIYRTQREYGLALDFLKLCTKRATTPQKRAECLYEEAQTYSFMQSWGQAKEVLEVLVKLEEAEENIHAQAVFLLADVFEQEMNFKKARELFESIADTYPNPKVIEIRLENLGKDQP